MNKSQDSPGCGVRAVEAMEVFGKAAGGKASFGDLSKAKVDRWGFRNCLRLHNNSMPILHMSR